MKKNLENFIRENREEFDTEVPAPRIWNNLEKILVEPQKKRTGNLYFMRKWAIAASVIMAVFAASYFFAIRNNNNQPLDGNSSAGTQPAHEKAMLDEINPGYAKELYHFTQLIELKQNELRQIGKDQPELYRQFMGDITKLDSAYTSLQKELPANPNREQLLEAMIQNLQLQTELLNQQLRVIKQIKQSKTSSNESNSKSI